jgi:hypothetical protein
MLVVIPGVVGRTTAAVDVKVPTRTTRLPAAKVLILEQLAHKSCTVTAGIEDNHVNLIRVAAAHVDITSKNNERMVILP